MEFLVGGGHELECYLGSGRWVKDLALFIGEPAVPGALRLIEERLGYESEVTFPHWLAKIKRAEHDHIDVIFNSGNGVCAVDDDWFRHAVPSTVMGEPVRLCPAEETIWSKAFVMERERYDGADIAHLLHAPAAALDCSRLPQRLGRHRLRLLTPLRR